MDENGQQTENIMDENDQERHNKYHAEVIKELHEIFRNETFRNGTFRNETFRNETFRNETFRNETFRNETFRNETKGKQPIDDRPTSNLHFRISCLMLIVT